MVQGNNKTRDHILSGRFHASCRPATLVLLLILILFPLFVPALANEPALAPVPGLPPANPVNLTDEEQAWIQAHPVIHVCIDPAYTPIESRDSSGAYSGLSLDYLERAGERTGLKFAIEPADNWNVCIEKIQKKQVDLLSAVYVTNLRKEYLIFSRPYYQNALVIVTKTGEPSGQTLEQLNGKTVAAVDGYTTQLILKKRFPGITMVPVPDVKTGLTKVAFGSADAFLGDLATVTYEVETEGITNLKVSGEYSSPDEGPLQFAFGVRNDQPVLAAVLSKGLAAMTPEENAVIVRRWISSSLTPAPSMDPRIVISLLAAAALVLIVIGVILVVNRALKRQIAKKTAELLKELEQRRIAEKALRESEQRNAAILSAFPDLLFIISREGKYLDVQVSNGTALSRPARNLIGLSIYDTGFDRVTARTIIQAIERTIDTGRPESITYDLTVAAGPRSYEARIIRLDADRILGVVQDITERKRMEEALQLARSKMSLLNTITFQDIQAGLFSLAAYVELMRKGEAAGTWKDYLDREVLILRRISESLKFARDYQDLGVTPPRWQNAQQVFLFAASHLDFSGISRHGSFEGIEIYADPLLEKAFFRITESILSTGIGVSEIILGYTEAEEGLVMTIGDNGRGISPGDKERIFGREGGRTPVPGLFLARQILSITGISLRENGSPGHGARFEILVPKGAYRRIGKTE